MIMKEKLNRVPVGKSSGAEVRAKFMQVSILIIDTFCLTVRSGSKRLWRGLSRASPAALSLMM